MRVAKDNGGTPKVCAHTSWDGKAPIYCGSTDVLLTGTVWLCDAHAWEVD